MAPRPDHTSLPDKPGPARWLAGVEATARSSRSLAADRAGQGTRAWPIGSCSSRSVWNPRHEIHNRQSHGICESRLCRPAWPCPAHGAVAAPGRLITPGVTPVSHEWDCWAVDSFPPAGPVATLTSPSLWLTAAVLELASIARYFRTSLWCPVALYDFPKTKGERPSYDSPKVTASNL